MSNQHIVDITIIWPDNKWEPETEQEYILSCLQGVREHFEHHPIQNTDLKLTLSNALGRIYAEVHVNPCR